MEYTKVTTVNGVTIDKEYLDDWRARFIAHIMEEFYGPERWRAYDMLKSLGATVNSPGALRGHEDYVKETYNLAARIVRKASGEK